MRSPPQAMRRLARACRFGAAGSPRRPDSPAEDSGGGEERQRDGGAGRPYEAHRREIRGERGVVAGESAKRFPERRSGGRGPPARIVAYQAWPVPQCGQPTDVVTAALNT